MDVPLQKRISSKLRLKDCYLYEFHIRAKPFQLLTKSKELIQQLDCLEAGGRFYELIRVAVAPVTTEVEELKFDDQPFPIADWLRSVFKDKNGMLNERLGQN